MSTTARTSLLFVAGMCLLTVAGVCSTVPPDDARRVCVNWLDRIVETTGDWAGSRQPGILEIQPVIGGDLLLGYYCSIIPSGYVFVPARDELPVVTAYSETSKYMTAGENPFMDLVRDQLRSRIQAIEEMRDTADAFTRDPTWLSYLAPPGQINKSAENQAQGFLDFEPLLTTRWGQHYPYNLFCPVIQGYTTFLGCTATAMAQVMAYHKWPLSGLGDHSYLWNGDQSCGGDSPPTTVYADFSDLYDWKNVVDEEGEMTPADQIAVAELCYETAVSLDMDFGLCSSGASLARARSSLVAYFRYAATARELMRFRYSTANWYLMIQQNLDAGRPIIYYTVVHTLVCDGWREVDAIKQIHLNYGWEGSNDDWYSIDSIYTSANPSSERMIVDIQPDFEQPISLADFSVVPGQVGAVVSWELGLAEDHVSFQLYRNASREKQLEAVYEPTIQLGTSYQVYDTEVSAGHYEYWLEAWQKDGTQMWFGPAEFDLIVAVPEPTLIRLGEAWPNPFNPRTRVTLRLDTAQQVRAGIYDLCGRLIKPILYGQLSPGEHILSWNGRCADGRAASSGRYFLRVEAGEFSETRKLMLAR